MIGRSLLFICVVLLPTGCDNDPPPEYAKPLAQWRDTKVAKRALPTVGGPTLQVPDSHDVLCIDPNPSNTYAGCGFDLDERTGRLATLQTEYSQRLDVEMVFEKGRFDSIRNEARIGADQRAASGPPLGQAAVEQALTGSSAGQQFAVGCWRRSAVNASGTGLDMNGPYACTLVIENRSLGATVLGYPAPRPESPGTPLDRTRLNRLIAMISAIEASFMPSSG